MDVRIALALAAALLPLASFVLPLAFARRSAGVRAGASIAAVALALAASLVLLAGQLASPSSISADIPWLHAGRLGLSMGVLVNPLSVLMLVIVTGVSLLVQIYSLGYMKGDPGFGRFFSFLSLFTFSMLTLVLADNFILLYMAWELVGLSSYLLIGFWYQRPSAARAAKKAFVVTRFGDVGFLIGILVLSLMAGSFDFGTVAAYIGGGNVPQGQVTLVVLLLFCGAIGKSGQFPLHVWLPDAMEGPTPVSALIHSATMVAAGVFMVARLYGIFSASADALRVVAGLGVFTAVFAGAIAIAQDDIKRILAYSTVSQLGYMMLALGAAGFSAAGVAGSGGYAAGMFHLTTHAAFKTLLFLGAGSVIHALDTNDIWKMGGLRKHMPVTAITFAVAVLAIAGIIPFSGFWSKDDILKAALDSGSTPLYAASLVGVFLTAFYMARLFFVAFTGKPRGEAHAHESPAVMTAPLVILAVLATGLGVVGLPWLPRDIHTFLDPSAVRSTGIDLPLLLQSDGLAILGIVGAWLLYRRSRAVDPLKRGLGPVYTALANRLYVDELYMLVIRGVFFTATRVVAWFDRHVVDGVVNLVGGSAKAGGDAARRTVSGRVQSYALIIVGGIAVVLILLLGLGGTR